MNNEELRRRLSEIPVPPVSEKACGRARSRALTAFANRMEAPERTGRWRISPWALASLAVTVGILLAFFWPRSMAPTGAEPDIKVLAEMEKLFPGQVDAVIEGGERGVDLALADEPRRSSDQPLLMEFSRAGIRLRVLSYSGRRVCVELAGKRACFEPLVSGQGSVIVSGDDFLWTHESEATFRGWKIHARTLPSAT